MSLAKSVLKAAAFWKAFGENLEKVAEKSLWVGTTADFASYVESGTGPHTQSGDGGFITRLLQWGKREGLTRGQVFATAQKIREEGTEPQPFYRPAINRIARKHDFIEVSTETPGRMDLIVNPIGLTEEDMTLEDVADELQKEMRRMAPKSRGEDGGLAGSIVVATSLQELRQKSQAALAGS